jgi:hypothetical protein
MIAHFGDLGGIGESFQLVGSFDTGARPDIYADTQTQVFVHLMQASWTCSPRNINF